MSKKDDVISGLKACREQGKGGCAKCPYAPDRCHELMKDALWLINYLWKINVNLKKGVST